MPDDRHPLMGITTLRSVQDKAVSHQIGDTYVTAIQKAGGIPILIPSGGAQTDLYCLRQKLDGILLSGGADIDPQRFNGAAHPRVYDVDAERDELEIHLMEIAFHTGWPVLGICRGLQVMNVALGGSLYTDIADQLPGALRHDCYPDHERDYPAHNVAISPNSRLMSIVQTDLFGVNSLHHQGIDNLAPGLTPTAKSPDGLIEAVELPDHPFAIGVQWHPEEMQDSPTMCAIFQAFIQAIYRTLPE